MAWIEGHSGATVRLIEGAGGLLVEKTTRDTSQISRLRKQCEKQLRFAQTNTLPGISTPAIDEVYDDSEHFTMRMRYHPGLDIFSFLQAARVNDLSRFANRVLQFVDYCIQNSPLISVPKKIFTDKLAEVRELVMANGLADPATMGYFDAAAQRLIDMPELLELPVGQSHGDLTFSNILITDAARLDLSLIDLLDSYIESPLVDMAKIRQDTAFFWSLNLLDTHVDHVRMKLALGYLDEIFHTNFNRWSWYRDYYHLVQCLNLLRILPYAVDDVRAGFILACLESLHEPDSAGKT